MVFKYVLVQLTPVTNPIAYLSPTSAYVKLYSKENKANILYYFTAEIIIPTNQIIWLFAKLNCLEVISLERAQFKNEEHYETGTIFM